MEILSFKLGPLETNAYLVFCPKTRRGLIIDPADEANFLSEKILREKIKPLAIIATHGHFDHLLAANELQLAFGIPFLIHPSDQKILSQMRQSASWHLKRKISEEPPKKLTFLKEGEEIHFGRESLTVIELPGHTPGSIGLYNFSQKIFFSGDTVFKDGVGRTDFSYSSPESLADSLQKIKAKFTGFKVFPGHGESFRL
ncbi:MBL fold metallo-hydrolase [Candidatus Shapirobacteria bacterium]|nr:MBL fold metallo-hydrolase [Candidatus Shapirobacteria bacterium]